MIVVIFGVISLLSGAVSLYFGVVKGGRRALRLVWSQQMITRYGEKLLLPCLHGSWLFGGCLPCLGIMSLLIKQLIIGSGQILSVSIGDTTTGDRPRF
jgi:hypothetical protein